MKVIKQESSNLKCGKIYGFSLLEVLIATFILAFGMLGIIELYASSLKKLQSSYKLTSVTSQKIAEHER